MKTELEGEFERKDQDDKHDTDDWAASSDGQGTDWLASSGKQEAEQAKICCRQSLL